MFEAYYTGMNEKLVPMKDFAPFPKYEDRTGWEKLPIAQRENLIKNGEQYLNYVWPIGPASLYMDFYRNGNRTRHQDIMVLGRRIPLLSLAIAECCEGKGRFIDDIINGLWTTMEESTWVQPAHNNQYSNKNDLPRPLADTEDPDNVYIDLFAGRTGAIIAWLWYTMGERLGQEAPQIPARMLGELQRRIIHPFMLHTEFGWMGYTGKPVNNWNPWIVSNIMTVAGLACPNEETRTALMEKCLECVDFFAKSYAPDGGCDEGPGYWNRAGSCFFDCVDLLYDMTAGKVDYFADDLLRNMCAYEYRVHISGDYFVNCADSKARVTPEGPQLYRMGVMTGDEDMKKFGLTAYRQNRTENDVPDMEQVMQGIYRAVKLLFVEEEMNAQPAADYPYVRDVWFPGIQVMAARTEYGTNRGLYLSAKGGTNGESHNHNDVGSFVLYCDGKPAVVDIGTAVYEKKTFSPQRYEILQMQSNYHNLPMVNGIGQLPGTEFAAQDAHYTCTDDKAEFCVELKGAYPAEAGIESWKRGYVFDRTDRTVTVADDFALAEEKEVQLVLITAAEPVFAAGEMTVAVDEETVLTAAFDPSLAHETAHFATAHDDNLRGSWGEAGVYRTVFTLPGKVNTGSHKFVFCKK